MHPTELGRGREHRGALDPGSMPGRSASPPRWWPRPRSRRQGRNRSRPATGMADESAPHLLVHRLLSHLSFRSVWFRNACAEPRAGTRSRRGRGHRRRARILGGARDVVGAAFQRARHRRHGPARRRRDRGRVPRRLAHHGRVADHTVLLWVLLPLAVLLSGMAPSMISFAAGQAAFTLSSSSSSTSLADGWKVGLTRIEDVAIGCGVSIVVGVLFWPRGATAALGRALSDAFVASSGYLADAVDRLTLTSRTSTPGQRSRRLTAPTCCSTTRSASSSPSAARRWSRSRPSAGSSRDRTACGWRRTPWPPFPVHPPPPGRPELESVASRAVLRDSYASSHRWYQEFADMLADRRDSLDSRVPHERSSTTSCGRRSTTCGPQRVDRVQTTLQMLWADELLENQSQMQKDLLASANLFVRGKHRGHPDLTPRSRRPVRRYGDAARRSGRRVSEVGAKRVRGCAPPDAHGGRRARWRRCCAACSSRRRRRRGNPRRQPRRIDDHDHEPRRPPSADDDSTRAPGATTTTGVPPATTRHHRQCPNTSSISRT